MRPLSIVLDDADDSRQGSVVNELGDGGVGNENEPGIIMHPGTLEELQNVNCSTLEYPKLEPDEEKLVDKMIAALLKERDVKDKNDVKCQLDIKDIAAVCKRTFEFFMLEPGLLRLNAPIKVVGDIHGQFLDLLRFLEIGGFPPNSSYLFLGDYIDRGKMGVECTMLLFCYKLKYPNLVHLLRGNHECTSISRIYGFHDECVQRFNADIWKQVNLAFRALPLAAIIRDRIFCTHGGLSPQMNSIDDILRIRRPTDTGVSAILNDLLWADPSPYIDSFEPSDRGISYVFGRKVLHEFMERYNFDLFVRAHQVVPAGFEFFPPGSRQLVTVFSAVNYCGQFDNAGAMLLIEEDLTCSFRVLRPEEHKEDSSRVE